ncbi:energy-coupling factor transporter transmembrane protein EcfT [Fulvimarina sp. 2208YS6-2-32]|uniref:Energy-coupling factor transporter transmembrane protein EcfT n=1 Tax=Fulvimarina uroteuthidis TaxID=3098149 RepID=A0ABU5I271_9HYPH|nr:energy-coupling factor transporter transmembrane protein EcfT [Fulvimarina sp. 2208YS6-2-32]MDY8109468.1 energy-coupling factor transporter transmembrane protein EcfT [Fulvimarina sp. 2208YS6-2-32]
MISGLYLAGTSPLHRAGAGQKLLALIGFGTVLLSLPSVVLAAVGLAVALIGYKVAGFPWRIAYRQIRAMLLFLAFLFAAQVWLVSLEAAALLALRFSALILSAGLVTLTTRTSDLVAALETALRPFERFGVHVEKVSLAISLTLRFIPLVAQVVEDVKEARAARGRERSMIALAVPVIIRLLKTADAIAEAIEARS